MHPGELLKGITVLAHGVQTQTQRRWSTQCTGCVDFPSPDGVHGAASVLQAQIAPVQNTINLKQSTTKTFTMESTSTRTNEFHFLRPRIKCAIFAMSESPAFLKSLATPKFAVPHQRIHDRAIGGFHVGDVRSFV